MASSPATSTTVPTYAPTADFLPSPLGFGAQPCAPCHFASTAATYPPHLSPGGYYTSSFPYFYGNPPAFPHPHPASAYTPASSFSPNQPTWPPPAPDPTLSTAPSTSSYSPLQALQPSHVSTSSKFHGDRSLQSPLCARPNLQQHKDGGCEIEEDGSVTMRYHCPVELEKNSREPIHFGDLQVPTTMQDASSAFGEMPKQYGFHNLSRQTVYLADGSEHSYYMLPEDSPVEQATSLPAGKNVGVMVPLAGAAQAEGLSPVRFSQTNNTAYSAQMLVHNLKLPMTVQDMSNVLKEMPVYDVYEEVIDMSEKMPVYDVYADDDNSCSVGSCNVLDTNFFIQQDGEGKPETEHTAEYFSNPSENEIPSQLPMYATATHQMQFETLESMPNDDVYEKEDSACLNIISDVRNFNLELQQQDGERACNCPFPKASDSLVTRSSRLSVDHSMSKLRLLWDPGASALLHSANSQSDEELGYVAMLVPKALNFCNQVGTSVQQLVTHESEKEWDPGEETILSSILNRDLVSVQYHTPHVLLVYSASYRESIENRLTDQKFTANASSKVAAPTGHISLPGASIILLSNATYTWDPGVPEVLHSYTANHPMGTRPGIFTHVLQSIFASAVKCFFAFGFEWTKVEVIATIAFVLAVPCSKASLKVNILCVPIKQRQ